MGIKFKLPATRYTDIQWSVGVVVGVGGVVSVVCTGDGVSVYRGFEHNTCPQLNAASLFHAVHPNVDRTKQFEDHVRSFS